MSGPALMMVVCVSVFALSLLVVASNFARAMRTGKLTGLFMLIHIVIGGLSAGSGLGLVAGFTWFLVDRYAG